MSRFAGGTIVLAFSNHCGWHEGHSKIALRRPLGSYALRVVHYSRSRSFSYSSFPEVQIAGGSQHREQQMLGAPLQRIARYFSPRARMNFLTSSKE